MKELGKIKYDKGATVYVRTSLTTFPWLYLRFVCSQFVSEWLNAKFGLAQNDWNTVENCA